MGLDSVEIVMEIEEAFDIEIRDEDAGGLRTVGQVYDYVLAALERRPAPAAPGACLTATAFYRLRAALLGATGAARGSIRPGSSLEAFLPFEGRRAAWSRLESRLGARLPELVRPRWAEAMIGALCVATLPASLLAAYLSLDDPATSFPVGILIGFVAVVTSGLILARATMPLARRFPPGVATVGDLAARVLGRNLRSFARESGREPTPEEVWVALRSIFAETLGVDPEAITPEARIVEDLGAG